MNLNQYLTNNGYSEGLGSGAAADAILTNDSVNNIVEKIGNTIIDKKNIEKYSMCTEYNHQLNEMIIIKDSLEQLHKSYNDLLYRTNNTSHVGQLEHLNRTVLTCKHDMDIIDNKLNHYSTLKEICEFLDENDHITLSNIDYCVDFKKMKETLNNDKIDDECVQLIIKRFDIFQQNINQFLTRYFVNIIEINQTNSLSIIIMKKNYDEFIKLFAYLSNVEEVIEQLNKKLIGFLKFCIQNPKKTMNKIEESTASISLEFKTQNNGTTNESSECGLQNIRCFFEFINQNFPYFDLSMDMGGTEKIALNFKKKLIHNLSKEMTIECSKMYLNSSSNKMKKYFTELTNYLETIQGVEPNDKFVEFAYSFNVESELNNNSTTTTSNLELDEQSTELCLLDSIRLLFIQDSFLSSITTFNKTTAFKEFIKPDGVVESSSDLEVDHPEYWKSLLGYPILLGDYSSSIIQIHKFVDDFIYLIAKFYFDPQEEAKFDTLRNAYKIFTLMMKHKFNEFQDQLSSFALFYNDLQILNYFTMVINLNLMSSSSSSSKLLTLGDYLIHLDDTFRCLITSVMGRYNNLLLNSTSVFELNYINSNTQKRNSNALHQIRESLRDFSMKHKSLLPEIVFEKYMGILANNIADAVTVKIMQLTDILENNIPIIEKLIGDIVDCFATYGLDMDSNDKLTKMPAVAQLKCTIRILKSNLHMIAQMWNDGDVDIRTNLTKEQLIKLVESIFQESNLRAGVIDQIRHEIFDV